MYKTCIKPIIRFYNPDPNPGQKFANFVAIICECDPRSIEDNLAGGGGGNGLGSANAAATPPAVLGDSCNVQQEIPPHQQYLERLKMLREAGGLGAANGGGAAVTAQPSGAASATSAYRDTTNKSLSGLIQSFNRSFLEVILDSGGNFEN